MSVKLKIKSGDTVKVISGKDKGQTGKVLKVYPKKNKALVEGINFVVKHIKKSQNHPRGDIVRMEKPVDISNISLFDSKTGKPSRVGFKTLEDGTKVRFLKKTGETLEKAS